MCGVSVFGESKVKGLKRILTSIFVGGNLMSIVLLLACCVSTWLSPSSHAHLSVMGLLFPFILLFNLLFIPFWLIFRPRYVVVPLVGVALCGAYVLDYFPIHVGSGSTDLGLKIVTWNVKGLSRKGTEGRTAEMLAYVDSLDADVLCLQEFYGGANCKAVHQHLDSLGYHHAITEGRRIYSRLPLSDVEEMEVASAKKNGMFTARLLLDDDTVTVFNVHLECNFIDQDDRTGGKEALRSRERERLEAEGRHLWDKLAVSAGYRSMQVDSLTRMLDTRYKGKSVIVCGDFNDTPISYAYQQLARRLENAFRNRGTGLGVTYNERFFWIRIDHLFHSKDWETQCVEIDHSVDISDHYPLIVRLKKR